MNWANRIAVLIIIIGSLSCIEPIYIFSKAILAQQFLNNAWKTTLENKGKATKPWQWADTFPVAKLSLLGSNNMQQLSAQPELKQLHNKNTLASWIILSGMTGRTMAFGPGWLQDSAKPNHIGNTVISAHNDSHFNILAQVNIGDTLTLEDSEGLTITYRINEMKIVDQSSNNAYQFSEKKMITLITCYPFEISKAPKTKRLVVTALAI